MINKQLRSFDIDYLISHNGGSWRVAYMYNNWGNNVMMLLPDYGDDYEINESIMGAPGSIYEIAGLVDQYIEEYPEHPFLISKGSFAECAAELQKRLAAYGGDFNRFIDESKIFSKWCRVVHACMISSTDQLAICASLGGWRSILDEIDNK